MHMLKLFLSALLVTIITGCAHPIGLAPDIAKIERDATKQPIKKNVAYYIADTSRALEVTSPGGGGDKVTYQPYRDIETAFYKMLSNIFANVTKLTSPPGNAGSQNQNVDFVITPQMTTNSSSPSPFTWPPTQFSISLTADVVDTNGKAVLTKTVSGEGKAEFDEFKRDVSLSARRASEDVLLKMQNALLEAPELRK